MHSNVCEYLWGGNLSVFKANSSNDKGRNISNTYKCMLIAENNYQNNMSN